MDEQTINKLYVEKPDEEVKLLCSYTTRREGFLDILLSGLLLSSQEAARLLGTIKTHRGSSMSSSNDENYFDSNSSISFSTGFVSFKYSNPAIKQRKDYLGGFGILAPLEKILARPILVFDHCSDIGGIENYHLTRDNLVAAVHRARKEGQLYDDGFGNFFEIRIASKNDKNHRPVSYPRLQLNSDVVVAIPESEKQGLEQALAERQNQYKRFLDKIAGKTPKELRWKVIDDRSLLYVEEMIPFIERLTQKVNLSYYPIEWYNDRNLDICLKRLAIT